MVKLTFMISAGQWFGFYISSGYFYRIGLGLFEISISFGRRGSVAYFIDGVMQGSGKAAQEVMDDPMKTGHKLPIGFISLLNGQPAEVRVEVEANRSKFFGSGADSKKESA